MLRQVGTDERPGTATAYEGGAREGAGCDGQGVHVLARLILHADSGFFSGELERCLQTKIQDDLRHKGTGLSTSRQWNGLAWRGKSEGYGRCRTQCCPLVASGVSVYSVNTSGSDTSPFAGTLPAVEQVGSFESIYRQYFDFVWSSVRRLGVAPAATDDIVQEVFIVIHTRLHTLEKPEALRSWIYGIVRRTVNGQHRSVRTREAARAKLSEAPSGLRIPTPLDVAEQNDKVELLRCLVDELEQQKREVFTLVELGELTVPEVADILQVPLNTAYSRLRAARQAFDEALARRTRARGETSE